MKTSKLILLILFMNCFLKSNSQNFADIKPPLQSQPTSTILCQDVINRSGCNFIQNDQFSNSATNTTNPFPFGQVQSWVETHGSPALSNFFTPPGTPPSGITA